MRKKHHWKSSRTLNTVCSRSSPVVGTTQHCTHRCFCITDSSHLLLNQRGLFVFVCLLLLSASCVSNLPHTLKSKKYSVCILGQ